MEGTHERKRSRGMNERLQNGKEWVRSESERGRGGREWEGGSVGGLGEWDGQTEKDSRREGISEVLG